MKLESISLKKDSAFSEKWVQQQIADDPSMLQLGDLVLREMERRQVRSRPTRSSATRP